MSTRSFATSLLSFSVGPMIGAFLSFALIPVITRLVDPALMGQLSMYTTAVALASLVGLLGMDQAYARDYLAAENRPSLFSSSIAVPLVVSILMAAGVVVFHAPVSRLLYGSPRTTATLLLAAAIPLSVVLRYVALSVRMNGAGMRYSAVQLAQKGTTLVATILFVVVLGPRLATVVAAPVVALVVAILVGLLLLPQSAFRFGRVATLIPSPATISAHLAYGLPLVVATTQHWTLNFLDKLALRTWSTFDELGLYAAAFRLGSVLLLFHQTFTAFWTPTAYRWYEEDVDPRRFQWVTEGVAAFLLASYGLLVAARRLIVLLLGPAYREAVVLVPALALVPLLMTLSETTVVGISFSRRTIWATWAMTGAALVNIAGNWLLVPRFGAIGAAVATVGAFFVLFWLRTVFANRLWYRFRLRLHVFVSFALVAMMAATVPTASVLVDLIVGLGGMALGAVIGYRIYRQYRAEPVS